MKNPTDRSRLVRRFRKASQKARWSGRRLTANWRALPDFIVIGAQKGGTTPLSHYLMEQHPSVIPPTDKEVHFYDRNYEKGIRWYRAHFPLLRLFDQGTVTGEASPYYLAHPHVPGRIALNQPSVKMIALLRDPKSRAVSHYHMSVRKGRETRPIEQAMLEEDEQIAEEWNRMIRDEAYDSEKYRYHSYKHRGRYAEQLARYYEHFDRKQILVLSSDALREQTRATLDRICGFIGIAPIPDETDISPWKVRAYPREVSSELSRHLDEYFAPLNQALWDIIGEDFGW